MQIESFFLNSSKTCHFIRQIA